MKINTSRKLLGDLEQAVMISVLALDDNAYGIAIIDEINKRTGRVFSTGAIYNVLIRLEEKLLLESYLGEITSERGGRRKCFYRMTDLGKEHLKNTKNFVDNLWKDVII